MIVVIPLVVAVLIVVYKGCKRKEKNHVIYVLQERYVKERTNYVKERIESRTILLVFQYYPIHD